MADRIVSVVVNGLPWEVHRFDEEGWLHRGRYSTVWLGGFPPGAKIEEVKRRTTMLKATLLNGHNEPS
jgi:hypothetical protein